MRRERRELTEEQRAKSEARKEQFRELAQTIGAMSDEDRAAMAERMAGAVTVEGHRISVHNACLLACQRPDATLIGGFNQWRTHGRTVRKGERGLMIWAPVKGRHGDGNGNGHGAEGPTAGPSAGELTAERPRFVMVTVFDVGQTDAL